MAKTIDNLSAAKVLHRLAMLHSLLEREGLSDADIQAVIDSKSLREQLVTHWKELQYDPVVELADKIFAGESPAARAALADNLRRSFRSGLQCLDAVHLHVIEMRFGLNGQLLADNETIAMLATTVPLDEVDDIIEEAIEDLRAEWCHVLH